jgi:hypothetical protein
LSCALAMPLEPSNTATKDARKGHTLMSILCFPSQKGTPIARGDCRKRFRSFLSFR